MVWCGLCGWCCGAGKEGFNSTLKDTPLEENTAPAFKALNPNVSAEPDYPPLIATAGVLFLEADHVTQLYFHNHSFYLKVSI